MEINNEKAKLEENEGRPIVYSNYCVHCWRQGKGKTRAIFVWGGDSLCEVCAYTYEASPMGMVELANTILEHTCLDATEADNLAKIILDKHL